MQRKDQRAIKYWVKGQLNKPTTDALRLTHLAAWFGGRLLAVRRKSTSGAVCIFVEDKMKDQVDFGRPPSRMWHLSVIGRDFHRLHELYAAFSNYDNLRGLKKPTASDFSRLAGAIEHIRKLTNATNEDIFRFVPDGPSVRVALSSLKHNRFKALAWKEPQDGQRIPVERGVSELLDANHAVFFNFDDAVLCKLKNQNIKVCEL